MGPLRVKFSLSGTLFSWIIVYQSGEKAFIQICMKTHSFSSQKSVGISWFWPHHLFYLLQTEKYIYLYILFHFNLKIVQDSNWLLSTVAAIMSQVSLSLPPRVVTSCHCHQQQCVLIHNLAWSSQIYDFQNDLICLLFVYCLKTLSLSPRRRTDWIFVPICACSHHNTTIF